MHLKIKRHCRNLSSLPYTTFLMTRAAISFFILLKIAYRVAKCSNVCQVLRINLSRSLTCSFFAFKSIFMRIIASADAVCCWFLSTTQIFHSALRRFVLSCKFPSSIYFYWVCSHNTRWLMVRAKLDVEEKNDEKLRKCKKIAVVRVIEVWIGGFNLNFSDTMLGRIFGFQEFLANFLACLLRFN